MIRNDLGIAAIRETRHRISAAHRHDAGLLVAYYQQLQEEYKERLLPAAKPVNGTSKAVTYPVPITGDHVLAENRPEEYGEAPDLPR
jgi:hypothetical protein